MFESLSFDYPSYFIGLCLLLGLVVAMVLYSWNSQWKDIAFWKRALLFILRALGVASIAFLLLGPVVQRLLERTEEAIVVVASDNSSSILEATSAEYVKDVNEKISTLVDNLESDFDVEMFRFGGDIQISEDTTLDQSTNISKALRYIDEQYADRNVGAIILATDGIFNEGRNPIYQNVNFNAGLFPIALGDTTVKRDLLIKNTLYNTIAYLGDDMELQVDVQSFNASGGRSKLRLYEKIAGEEKLVDEKEVSINGDPFFQSYNFTVTPSTAGNISYRVSLSPLSDEISTRNNSKTLYIDVIDARQKVMILAEGPHPDLSAIYQSLSQNKNYEIEIKYAADKPINVNQANLVIFHNLPSRSWDIASEIEALNKRRVPRVFMTGSQTDYTRFNSLEQGVRVNGFNQSMNASEPVYQQGFSEFIISERSANVLKQFPPVSSPFGEFKVESDSKLFARQRVSTIETNYPLIVFNERNGIRKTILLGEGIWKWRLFDYLTYEDHEGFDDLWQKIIQYTSLKEDKRPFRVNVNKEDLKVNESLLFDAQLYNELYQNINDPEVSLDIKNTAGEQFNYQFSRVDDYYFLDAGSLPEGQYTYQAKTNYNGKVLSDKGSFVVRSIQKEAYDLTADHGLLVTLSNQFNGQVVYPENIAGLADIIRSSDRVKPVLYTERDNQSILQFWWLMIPILLMLFIEWFMRRYAGSY